MWYDATLRDNDITEELVQPTWDRSGQYSASRRRRTRYALLVVPDCKLQVTGDNTLLLVVARRVPRELEDFGGEVLEDSREVDCKRRPL